MSFKLGVSALALAAFAAASAQAQSAPDNGSQPTDATQSSKAQVASSPQGTTQPAELADPSEIVVTALRRSESVLKVPAAISAISGGDLRTKGVVNVTDLQNVVPGVSVQTGQDGITIGIRGVRTTDTSSKGEQDIAFNIDGVYVGRGAARGSSFFDVDRVEVLRGPQGTLYGRSATGGAINVITNKPRLGETDGYAKVEYGNYDAKRAEGAFNLPISDFLALRVAGSFNDRDGYSKPVSYSQTVNGVVYHFDANSEAAKNDQKDVTGRFSLLFQPSQSFTARFTATIGNQRGVGTGPALESFLKTKSGADALDILANPAPSFLHSHFANFDGSVNWQFGNTQVDVMASHQKFRDLQQRTGVQDILQNNGFLNLFRQENDADTTQGEVRLSNVQTTTIDYVVGANYFKEDLFEDGHFWNVPPGTPTDTSTYQHSFEPFNNTSHKSYGVFGQATWHVTDRLGMVGGARYTHDAVNRDGRLALPFFQCTYPNPCQGIPNQGTAKDSKVTWRAGVNFQLDAADLIYASVSTGFKGGGFNDYDPSSTNASGTGSYSPSSLTAYELGYKGRPFAGLTLASSLFYYDFSKDQITGNVSFPASGQTIIYTVGAPTEIYGIENEFTYQVMRGTVLSGTASYQRSRYLNFLAGSVFGDQQQWRGLDLDQTPHFVATAALDHAFDLPNDASLRLRGAIKYSTSYWLSDIADVVRYRQPSFTRSDLSLTYAPSNDRYSFQLFVENLENKVQRTSSPGGYPPACPYGGTGGQCKVNGVPVYPTLGNGTIPASVPFGWLTFSTSTPRYFGARFTVRL